MARVQFLQCRECKKEYEKKALYVCDHCFGPLEVSYDYQEIKKTLSQSTLKNRPWNMWRYAELLPLDEAPSVGVQVGGTPLVRARNLEKILGVRELWIKNDAACYPTHSFKDRVVSVALSKAVELEFKTVACASTGNLANSVAANAAAAGLEAYVFIPADLESEKILLSKVYGAHVIGINGHYDEVNRLCSEITNVLPWAFANINLRPFYSEGSKTLAYEVVEELGWKLPDHFISPMAGGSLLTKVHKAFSELKKLGFVQEHATCKIHGAQASGCAPIVDAWRDNLEHFRPVKKPETIAKSLAIGNPADGYFALQAIRDSQGSADSVSDSEILAAIELLAESEGIFTETAGGVTLGVTRKLIEKGTIKHDSSVVVAITGNGLKTQEYFREKGKDFPVIPAKLNDFVELLKKKSVLQEATQRKS